MHFEDLRFERLKALPNIGRPCWRAMWWLTRIARGRDWVPGSAGCCSKQESKRSCDCLSKRDVRSFSREHKVPQGYSPLLVKRGARYALRDDVQKGEGRLKSQGLPDICLLTLDFQPVTMMF